MPSAGADRLSKAAVARGVDVVMGINEVAGGTLYNSLLYLMADGQMAVHRKLVPTHAERMIWAASEDGSGLAGAGHSVRRARRSGVLGALDAADAVCDACAVGADPRGGVAVGV